MTEEFKSISVKSETRKRLQILKAEKEVRSYDDLINEEFLEE